MIDKGSKSNDLIAAAGVLELARVETRTAAEEVVNLASFDVIGEAGDEEGVDAVAAVVRLGEEVGVEWLLVSHRQRRLWRSAACQSPSTNREEMLVGIC